MRKVRLGELEVSALGLGCMGMSQSYGEADRDEAQRTLHRALDLGVTFLDTANVYGGGHNESLIGETLQERRHQFVLATKFGFVAKDGKPGVDGHPDRVADRQRPRGLSYGTWRPGDGHQPELAIVVRDVQLNRRLSGIVERDDAGE